MRKKDSLSNRGDDLFDRSHIGNPGCMVLILAAIILGSIIYNYFN